MEKDVREFAFQKHNKCKEILKGQQIHEKQNINF